jgi:hypothetical protein
VTRSLSSEFAPTSRNSPSENSRGLIHIESENARAKPVLASLQLRRWELAASSKIWSGR